MKLFNGLMGVSNDGKTLYAPDGTKLFKLPFGLAWKVQAIQHWIYNKYFSYQRVM